MGKKNCLLVILALALVGCPNDTTDEYKEKTPEEKSTTERWHSWADSASGVTITHSVANDGVVTVTAGGTTQQNRWKASARYEYTVQKDATYIYQFEAWTEPGSGSRTLTVEYYGLGWITAGPPFLREYPVITDERKAYTIRGTITGDPPPNSGVSFLNFQCADQLGTFYVKVIAITQINSGDFLYSEDPSAITIIGYTGNGGNITIPATINEKPVTAIGENALLNKNLTGVIIPNSVTSIEEWAFMNNQLTSVTIGNSVAYIGKNAFSNNQLTNVIIPDSVTEIAARAFWDNQLTSLTIGNSVIYIGDGAFATNQLTSVIIPNSVTEIGREAFEIYSLTSVTIGANVTLGYLAFLGNFTTVYDNEGKAAGTYIRSEGTFGPTWTKEP